MIHKSLLLLASVFVAACGGGTNSEVNTKVAETVTTPTSSTAPEFDAEATFKHIATQVGFGPRVPGSEAQLKCADWMQQQLAQYCDTVYRQETTVVAGDKKTNLRCINLVGAVNPAAKRRVLFLAHWDSRPWADRDATGKDQPILAADDGASGVAVLIELARALKSKPLPADWGVDILLTDVEDWGKSEWGENSYALGTQYWAHNPHVPDYTAEAGILLDMVGGANARFPLEANSMAYARNVLVKVWEAAEQAGYGSYFVYENGGGITDDHVPVNEIRHIPTIDIINLPLGSNSGFVEHWHTHADNMEVIDKRTLKAVGQTLLTYLYSL